MTVHTRLTRPDLWRVFILAAVLVFALLTDSAAFVLVVLAFAAVEAVRCLHVSIEGGGYRPIRMTDFIDEIAMDELDRYDAEEAAADARRQAQAQQNAPRW